MRATCYVPAILTISSVLRLVKGSWWDVTRSAVGLGGRADLFALQDAADETDQVKWKWTKGEATTFAELGAPATTDEHAFCIYDGGSTLLLKMTAPAGGTCGTKPCWKQLGSPLAPKGFKYKDKDGLPDDLDSLTLKSGTEGRAKVSIEA